MKRFFLISLIFFILSFIGISFAADVVPTDIQQPGTQPQEIGNLSGPDRCDNCHGGYNTAVEPAFNWRGSMMANAGRDPIFWATLAIAEQDFDGAGDLCIRCHSTAGWLAGRSTPTDGSGLGSGDSDGVECDFCHKMTNPDNSDPVLQGVQFFPFWANNEGDPVSTTPIIGYYGSGMSSMWGDSDMLGPYIDAEARHQFMQSKFYRDVNFCGTCHDVSNPAVGNLAPNHGTQATADQVTANGILGGPVDGKAAFNNFPYKYGIVERTFSEYKSGLISQTLVSEYMTLPADLQGGALEQVYIAALEAGTNGNYEDGTDRYYSCQTCHMRPVTGQGCNKNPAVRNDLPLHDMTGGNYWMPDAIQYLDGQDKLRLGGGLTSVQTAALDAGKLRAMEQLELAASLSMQGTTLKIVNHTGHKLISGYPEGRRMWLNIKWYDSSGVLIREDGEYGPIDVTVTNPNPNGPAGTTVQVESIIDLHDPNTKIYEAHYGMTQEWASGLLALHPADLPLSYDRLNVTGLADFTLGDLAASSPGTEHETFHFVLNNTVVKDNRIPPYGMDYEEARKRNALPVPADQYGGTPGGTYNYFDEVSLNPPSGAKSATIDLLYQTTSWEYIQFLYLANNGQNPFLANEGIYMLEAWLNNGMSAPYTMASTTWRTDAQCTAPIPTLLSATPGDSQVTAAWQEISSDPAVLGYRLYYDQAGKAQLVTELLDPASNHYVDTGLTNGQEYCYKVTSLYDCDGDGILEDSGFSNILCAIPQNPGQTLFAGVDDMQTGKFVTTGKGKKQTTEFVITTTFNAGDAVVVQAHVVDEGGVALPDASVEITLNDPNGAPVTTLITGPSDATGWAEATWQTQKPSKKGQGGTPSGTYTTVTNGVTVSGYAWDGVLTNTQFTIQ